MIKKACPISESQLITDSDTDGPGGRGRAEGGLPDELARGVQAPGGAEGDIDQTSAGTGERELN